jgi:hypothetical protein
MTIKAEIVADSINPTGNRLTTYRLYYPRCIHSEVMTHRVFSRNSASSRAIPIERMIQRVLDDPFIPKWSIAQQGMMVTEEFTGDATAFPEATWKAAMAKSIVLARELADYQVAKSVVNRLLEPWMHIEVVLSGTEFNNFFTLRDDAAAEPHLRELAHMMKELRANNEPVLREPMGLRICQALYSALLKVAAVDNLRWYNDDERWHLPFISDTQRAIYQAGCHTAQIVALVKESVAHAAWVSYGNIDGKPGFTQDDVDRVYDKLVGSQPIHASPAEHVAVACDGPHRHGNFTGWCQWRMFLPNQSGGDYPA